MDAAMTARHYATRSSRLRSERGTSLIETMIACAVLLVTLTGLAGITTVATSTTENEGHLSARTTEYAVDKMEQLLALAYGDAQSNTTVFPSTTEGGTGLAEGGSADPEDPEDGYSDYLDHFGNPLCTVDSPCEGEPPADWYYMRAWEISTPVGAANLKQITITSTIRVSVGGALRARSTVVALKTNCPGGC